MSESRVTISNNLSKFTQCMTHVPASALDDLLYHRFIVFKKKKTNEHDYLTCERLVERGQWLPALDDGQAFVDFTKLSHFYC